ncbi:DMT family transporter [Acinetobacter sp. HY1485]|uniref:DMT family transporter n=1 Tax=Acinetobacter sp. HY1485 TaxID=2970918 RepID=UPI0022B94DA2|nr:EamA family transporter [Acinetobacter sp. HY1485]
MNLGFWAILFTSFLWGTTGVVASFAPQLSPFAIGAAAMGGGGILQALFAIKSLKREIFCLTQSFKLIILGGLAVAVYPLAFYASMHYAGITIGTVISIGSAPLFSALLERFFDAKKLTLTWFLSVGLGILGVVLLSMGEGSHPLGNHKNLGIGLGILAGISYALYSWLARRVMHSGISSKATMGAIFGIGGIILLPTLAFTGQNLFENTTHTLVITYMTIFPMFLGYVLFGYGLKKVTASTALTITLSEPLIAALLAMLIVKEILSFVGVIGMILIIVSIFIVSYRPKI